MKKIYLALCLALTMMIITACGGSVETTATTGVDEQTVLEAGNALLQSWTEVDWSSLMTEEGFEQYVANYGQALAEEAKSWQEVKLEIGASAGVPYSVDHQEFYYNDHDKTSTVSITATYPEKSLIFKVVFDSDLNYTSISLELVRSMGEKIINGLLNTVMGMGIVFVVLLMISFIISLFKYIPLLLERTKKQEVVAPEVVMPESAPLVEEEEVVDDTELVAVITAAIMASMGDEAPADGLRVRSIRRVNKKWKNA